MPQSPQCPYVGLQPFREEDYPYFFGRERDIRVISSNLREQPLTIVYGASGVGKSSALRAGVLPHLRTDAGAVPVYFNTWQNDSFLEDLTDRCNTALDVRGTPIDKLLASGKRRLFLVLDQFEEFLLYHTAGRRAEEFDSLLARIVNRGDLAANVLIGIREDALSRFDQRFSIRIADLLSNTLPLEHLHNDAARRAMNEPLRVLNEQCVLGANGYSMEPELADEILNQVQPRRFAEDDAGALVANEGRVETPFLQLVLRRLWDEEAKAGSRSLRLDTLKQIGGARQIVEKHVEEVLKNLPGDRDRAIAARMFSYLVTPSRSKISQDTESLVGYAEAPETEVRKVLSWLSDRPESRILRRLDSPERYEIFHDVLAQPILDWRKRHFAQNERRAELAKRRRLQMLTGAMALLALAAVGFAIFAFNQRRFAFEQRRKATEAADLYRIENLRAIAAAKDAEAARHDAERTTALLQANQAELAGRTEEAARFRTRADDYSAQARDLARQANDARTKAGAAALEGERNYRDAAQQIADLQRERDGLKAQVASLSTEVDRLKNPPAEKNTPPKQPEKKAPPPDSPPPSAKITLLRTIKVTSGKVLDVAASPDGRRAIVATGEFGVNVWDLDRSLVQQSFHNLPATYDNVAASPDWSRAVAASNNKALEIWDLENTLSLGTLGSDRVSALLVPSGRRAFSASADNTITMWDLPSRSRQLTFTGHSGTVRALAVSYDRRLVSGSEDKTVRVWELPTGQLIRTMTRHTAGVKAVAVAPNGRWVVSSSGGTPLVWDLDTLEIVSTLSSPIPVYADRLAISPDGRWLLAASVGAMLTLWNLESGALADSFKHDAAFTSCAFSGSGRLVTGDAKGRIHLFSLELPGKP